MKEDKHLLDQCFVFFKSRQMYGYIEEFALEAAEYFRRVERFEMASDYYHIVNLARTEIKKEKSYMKIKMIILALMIVGSVAISDELIKSENAYFEKPF